MVNHGAFFLTKKKPTTKKGRAMIPLLIIACALLSTSAYAETYTYPGPCGAKFLYTQHPTAKSDYANSLTISPTGSVTYGTAHYAAQTPGATWALWWKSNNNCTQANPSACWSVKGQDPNVNYYEPLPTGTNVGSSTVISPSVYSQVSQYLTCGPDCTAKTNQEAAPVFIGLPYHLPYYETVGLCVDQCEAKPITPPGQAGIVTSGFASDGSGYTIGPWTYTGQQCVAGVHSTPPEQPAPEDQCSALRNACEAQCQGRSYGVNCENGECICLDAPSYNTDPPLEPTTPTPTPNNTPAPQPDQTAAADPGGDLQQSAQIANQAKQITQNNQIKNELGAVNGKLDALNSNLAKQIGQADKLNDYERQELGVLKDIRQDVKDVEKAIKDFTAAPNNGLPGYGETDNGLGTDKNWTEFDNPDQVGEDRFNRVKQQIQQYDNPVSFDVTTNGSSPVLSGEMFGRTIQIRFDRPWMETGYSIMHALFIGIGYLQVFLMVNRHLFSGGK